VATHCQLDFQVSLQSDKTNLTCMVTIATAVILKISNSKCTSTHLQDHSYTEKEEEKTDILHSKSACFYYYTMRQQQLLTFVEINIRIYRSKIYDIYQSQKAKENIIYLHVFFVNFNGTFNFRVT
jgi:hypothetical protein